MIKFIVMTIAAPTPKVYERNGRTVLFKGFVAIYDSRRFLGKRPLIGCPYL